jgi:hypothetical protein
MVPHLLEQEHPYEIVKVITLPAIDFENFIADMLADRQFLEDNSPLCSRGSCIRCLCVRRRGGAEAVLVLPNRAWVDLAALLCE